MKSKEKSGGSILERIGGFAQHRSGWIILGTLLITLLLFIPLLAMGPDGRASDNPGGEVFDIQDEIDEILPSSVHYIAYIVEAREGDVLTQEVLWELYQNEDNLRQSETLSDYLYTRYDVESGTTTFGVYTVADAIQTFLQDQFGISLENANDDQVKLAVHYVLSAPESSDMVDWLSEGAEHETKTVLGQEIEYWTSPGFVNTVNTDNSKVLNEYAESLLGSYTDTLVKEKFDRDVQEILRGDQESYQIWAIAIDANLEAEDEAAVSIPLIIAAIILILIVVTIHFRSLQVNALTTLALLMLIVWLKGISNLVGLKSSLTLDILVPIAILVLGVDYVIHAVHRYREETENGYDPGNALKYSIAGVGGALILAMLTTVVAFLSNASSGIEDIVGFGIGAAIAIFSALIIMGLFIPTLKMRWDARRLRKRTAKGKLGEGAISSAQGGKQHGAFLSRVVCFLADWKAVVLPLILVLSIAAGFFAIKLEAKLDVKEYFDSNSDFVVSLDKLDEHVGNKGGEPATIYIKGDLSNPESLIAIQNMISNMDDDKTVARDPNDNSPNVYASIFDYLDDVLETDIAIERIEAANPGISITDIDSDGIPDEKEQVKAIFDYIVVNGIPLDEETLRYEPAQIKESLFHDPDGIENDATVVWIGIPDTREQATVKESRREITEDMEALEVDSISYAGLTGSGYERDATLDAITNSLNTSIIIAIVACLLLLIVAFRSLRYGIVTVIPVILVAAWLYAIMYLAGYHLNAVTATIAAISIGVGVDYSVHVTARFRQELKKSPNRRTALEKTIRQTGSALFGSAASTTLGFLVIGLAPMPMFSAFGILTALMILLAFIAALVVLPSMLMLVTRKATGTIQ